MRLGQNKKQQEEREEVEKQQEPKKEEETPIKPSVKIIAAEVVQGGIKYVILSNVLLGEVGTDLKLLSEESKKEE
jgi:hypothetical protein